MSAAPLSWWSVGSGGLTHCEAPGGRSLRGTLFFFVKVCDAKLGFFLASVENHRITPPAHSGAEDSVRLLLTKNARAACSFSCPWYQVHRPSFERFPRPWQTVGLTSGPFHVADTSLAFLKITLDEQNIAGHSSRNMIKPSPLLTYISFFHYVSNEWIS